MDHSLIDDPIIPDKGILQEIFDQLPTIAIHEIIFAWAKEFQRDDAAKFQHDPVFTALFSTITSLAFRDNAKFLIDEFKLLQYLPLGNLHELVIERCWPTDTQLHHFLSTCPIFNNLRTLVLRHGAYALPCDGSNTFPYLTKLEVDLLSDSSVFASPTLFPSLQILKIGRLNGPHPSTSPSHSSPPLRATFCLEELHLENTSKWADWVWPLLQSPICTNLKKFYLHNPCTNLMNRLIDDGSSRYLYSLTGPRFDDELWSKLFDSPILTNLHTLMFHCPSVSALKSFAASPYLANLRNLYFIAASDVLEPLSLLLLSLNAKLEKLHFHNPMISPQDLDVLAACPRCLSGLTELTLIASTWIKHPSISIDGLSPLPVALLNLVHTSPTLFSTLNSLEISTWTSIDNDGALSAFLTSPNLSDHLTVLNLRGFEFTDDLAHILGTQLANTSNPNPKLLKFGQLRDLYVTGCDLTPRSLDSFFKLSSLTHFEIFTEDVGPGILLPFLSPHPELSTPSRPCPILPELVSLTLAGGPISDSALQALAQSALFEQLNSLTLPVFAPVTYDGIVSLLTAPRACNLNNLVLYGHDYELNEPLNEVLDSVNHLKYCSVDLDS